MSSLPRADAAEFEDHLLLCQRCTAAVADVYNYQRAQQIAAQRLRPKVRTAGSH